MADKDNPIGQFWRVPDTQSLGAAIRETWERNGHDYQRVLASPMVQEALFREDIALEYRKAVLFALTTLAFKEATIKPDPPAVRFHPPPKPGHPSDPGYDPYIFFEKVVANPLRMVQRSMRPGKNGDYTGTIASRLALYENEKLSDSERRAEIAQQSNTMTTQRLVSGIKRDRDDIVILDDDDINVPGSKRQKVGTDYDNLLDEYATVTVSLPLDLSSSSSDYNNNDRLRYRCLTIKVASGYDESIKTKFAGFDLPTDLMDLMQWKFGTVLGSGGSAVTAVLNDQFAIKIGFFTKKEYSQARLMGDYDIGPRVYQYVKFQLEDDYAIEFLIMEQLEMTFADWLLTHSSTITPHPKQLTAYDAIKFDQLIERAFRVGLIHYDLHYRNVMVQSVVKDDPWQIQSFYLIDFAHVELLWSNLTQEERDTELKKTYQPQFDNNFWLYIKPSLIKFVSHIISDPQFVEYFHTLLILYVKHHNLGRYHKRGERRMVMRPYEEVLETVRNIRLDEIENLDWKPVLSEADHYDVIKMIVELYPSGTTASIYAASSFSPATSHVGLEELPAAVLLQVLPRIVVN